jgi:type VI secretion system protein ImpK
MASQDNGAPLAADAAEAPSADAAIRLRTEVVLEELLFSQAANLARAGRYDAAELLLRDLAVFHPAPEVLDLLARVRAQQGRLAEARAFWRQVDLIEPGHSGAQAALHRIARIARARDFWRTVGQKLSQWWRKVAKRRAANHHSGHVGEPSDVASQQDTRR